MISSTSNKQVKYVNALVKKAKTRREEDLFVVEGIRMFEELPKERVSSVYVSSGFLKTADNKKLLAGFSRVEEVSNDVFESMSDTRTPQGILALVRQYHYSLKEVLEAGDKAGKKPLLMVLEHLQDPGNLGTILRAGEGAGVTGIIMDEETADIYNPKVIRSTMGSVFRVPFVYVNSLSEVLPVLKRAGIAVYAAHLEGSLSYDEEDYTKGTAFLIGNEAAGLSTEAARLSDTLIRVPMEGKVESLNAAVASAVLMFEAARQRRKK